MLPFERDNVEAYRLILRIEVAVREILKAALEEAHGLNWRKRLPGDQLKVIRAAENDEGKRPQFGFLRLGPLYYLTLGELIPILRQSKTMTAVKQVGGEMFVQALESILAPRNAVAHSRSVSPAGLTTIQAVHEQLMAAMTAARLETLLGSPDVGLFPQEARALLISWLEGVNACFAQLLTPCPPDLDYVSASRQYWWGDAQLAGFDCSPIDVAATLVRRYNQLPRGLGTALLAQNLLDQECGMAVVQSALSALEVASG